MKGKNNSITDVPGVLVGHKTIVDGDIQTGVTAILPRPFDWFRYKTRAACHIINGFGKSIGLIQVDELHTIETPILLTNTLSAPHVADSLIKYMLRYNEEIGHVSTVNPLVCECNDGYLNNIRKQVILEHDVFHALNNAAVDFDRGSVGAGRGMSAYQLKGGIGTASRLVELDKTYTIGCLVNSNMGSLKDFRYHGEPIGDELQRKLDLETHEDHGSIIIVIATDLPLESHQLKRLSKRACAGLSRTGTIIGHGSGDIVIAFTTDSPIPIEPAEQVMYRQILHDNYLEGVFRATVDVVEAAVLDSIESAHEVTGFHGRTRRALKDLAAQ